MHRTGRMVSVVELTIEVSSKHYDRHQLVPHLTSRELVLGVPRPETSSDSTLRSGDDDNGGFGYLRFEPAARFRQLHCLGWAKRGLVRLRGKRMGETDPRLLRRMINR